MNKEKSVEILNKAVAMEMTALNQYMYFHFLCEDRGYEPLAAIFKRTSIVEMIHLETLAERILFLGGDVLMKMDAPVKNLHEVEDMIKYSRELEETTVEAYNGFAKQASDNADSATKKLFEELVQAEEGHFDNFDIEEKNLAGFGKEYLTLQAYKHSKEVAEKLAKK